MVATDGHRMALVELPESGSMASERCTGAAQGAPGAAANGQRRRLRFRRGEHHLSFRLGRRELICRILEGTFPDYERVIAKDNDKRSYFDGGRWVDLTHRVAFLTGDRARVIRLRLEPGGCGRSRPSTRTWARRWTIGCEYDDSTLKIGLNPDYLAQFLAAIDTERVRLDFKDENCQCVGHPVEASKAVATSA